MKLAEKQKGSKMYIAIDGSGVAKHTPGPWRVERLSECGDAQIFSPEHGHIANLTAGSVQEIDRNRANAELIAAAPCLLRHLKKMASEFCEECGQCCGGDPCCDQMQEAWEVIAKAEGAENGG